MEFAFICNAFRDGQHIVTKGVVPQDRLIREMGKANILTFHQLLDQWNKVGIIGATSGFGGPIYVYTADI